MNVLCDDTSLLFSDSGDDVEEDLSLREQFQLSVAVGQHAFAKMESDHDASRRLKLKGRTNIEAERAFIVRRYVLHWSASRGLNTESRHLLQKIFHSPVNIGWTVLF